MFGNENYYQINHEENHLGFLLVSELLNNGPFREKFFQLLADETKLSLSPHEFDIYTEAAVLRDYWHAFEYEPEYPDQPQELRYAIVRKILDNRGYQDLNIDEHDVFWTSDDAEKRKLCYPGQWSKEPLMALEKKEHDLYSIRCYFNIKPDVLIECNNAFVFMEIKVESNKSTYEAGLDQIRVQEETGALIKKLAPAYKSKVFKQTTLTLHDETGIQWREVMELLVLSNRKNIGYDKALRGLERLNRYY